MKIAAFLSLIRPRTLPLIVCAVGYGIMPLGKEWFLSLQHGLVLATAICIQIFSNIANDYGDYKNGADKNRKDRMSASGGMSAKWIKIWLYAFGFLGFVLGVILVLYTAKSIAIAVSFLTIGMACILAAYFYTAGSKPYGYMALGDISVFIFFGIIGVLGTYYLCGKENNMVLSMLWPAIGMGSFSVSVLNINNLRDIETDKLAGKITIANTLGKTNALGYQLLLYIFTIICFMKHSFDFWNSHEPNWSSFIFIILTVFLSYFWIKLTKAKAHEAFTKLLKQSSIAFFLAYLAIAILFLVN